MEAPAPRTPDASTREWRLSPWSAVAMGAIVWMLLLGLYIVANKSRPASRITAADWQLFLTYAGVLAVLASGFRRLGALLAFILFAVLAKYVYVLAALSFFDAQAVLIFLQIAIAHSVMGLAALGDLYVARGKILPSMPIKYRLGGLGASVSLVGIIALTGARSATATRERFVAKRVSDSATFVEQSAERAYYSSWSSVSPYKSLSDLAECIERFRGDDVAGPYPRSLKQLARWSETHSSRCATTLFKGDSNEARFGPHHVVRYTPPGGPVSPWHAGGFSLSVQAIWDSTDAPRPADSLITRNYLIDTRGRVHMTREQRPATVNDTVAMWCDPKSPRWHGDDCTVARRPRERWGVARYKLPRVSLSISGDGNLIVGEEVTALPHFGPFIPEDAVVAFIYAWKATDPETIERVGARRPFHSEGYYRVTHAYADTGQFTARFGVRTLSGDTYITTTTFKVRPRR